MKNNTLWIVIAVIIVLGLGWWWYASTQQAPLSQETATDTGAVAGSQFVDNSKDSAPSQGTGASATITLGAAVTVTYTDAGFSPASVSVKQGQSITFVNKSSNKMWVASDPHPTHEGYSGTTKDQHCPDTAGTAFDECSFATTYTFTFGKAGSWGYHNHAAHDHVGTVIVTP